MNRLGACLLALAIAELSPGVRAATPDLPGTSLYHQSAQLTDQDNNGMAWADLQGKPQVVTMFYAHCHLMCPLILENAKATWKQLSPQEQTQLGMTLITLDPLRDTPAALADIGQQYRVPDTWRLVRSRPNEVRPLASVLGVQYRAREDGSINHTSVLVLLDAQGRELARSEVAGIAPDPAFVQHIRKAIEANPAITSIPSKGDTP